MGKEKLKNIVKSCYEHSFEPTILEPYTLDLMNSYVKSKSVPLESVFFGTMASIAGICGQSFVKVHDDYMQPLSIFVLYSGLPGSNKSSAISIQKNEFSEMEKFCQILKKKEISDNNEEATSSLSDSNESEARSAINSSATIESLLEELSYCNCMVQFWDELTTLISSFGLYKPGGGAYDRSFFLTLFNGEKCVCHTTKRYKLNLVTPRLSIFAAGHPHKIYSMLLGEKNVEDVCDGLLSRCFTFNPRPIRLKLDEIVTFDNKYRLRHIYCAVKILHNKSVIYCFDEGAFSFLTTAFETYDKNIEENEFKECYLSFIYSKAKNHLLRLAGILWILENSINLVKDIDFDHLSFENLKKILDDKLVPEKIDIGCTKRAHKINEYLINQKLALSGLYDCSETYQETTPLINRTKTFENKSLEKTILLTSGKTVFLQDLSRRNLSTKKSFEEATKNLTIDGLGTYSLLKSEKTKKKRRVFEKKELLHDYLNDISSVQFVNQLLKYSVGAKEYIESYNEVSNLHIKTGKVSSDSDDENNDLIIDIENPKKRSSEDDNNNILKESKKINLSFD